VRLPVKWAEDGETLQPATIYLAPQDQHTSVTAGRRFRLWPGKKINQSRPAAGPLFLSTAEYYGSRSIGVILSGALFDGADGAAQLTRAGGTVLVQDRASSRDFSMPLAALRRIKGDLAFPPEILATMLVALVTGGSRGYGQAALP
jgi:two-component system chemotaxis response regulator CheB